MHRNNKSLGFTLIELLVVMTIISIVTGIALLTLNVNKNKQIESISYQFAQLLSLAEMEAMLRPTTLGFMIEKQTFQFYEYNSTLNLHKNGWHLLSDKLLSAHRISDYIQMTVKTQKQQTNQTELPIIITPNGDLTPFIIWIGKKNEAPHYKIIGQANGSVTVESIA